MSNFFSSSCLDTPSKRADYVKKLQGIASHERKMKHRSLAAINERLGKLGLSSIQSKKSTTERTAVV